MTTMLAMSIGSANLSGASAAAVSSGRTAPATVLTAASALTVHADGTAEIGAHPGPGADVIRDFAPRFGDPVPLVTPLGQSYTGTEVTVAALASMAAQCTADADPALYVGYPLTVPASAIENAAAQLRERGFSDVRFIPDSVAAAAWAQSNGDLSAGDVAAVYDLGASGLTITMVQVGARPGLATILGAPVHSEEFGGSHVDAALLRQVLQGVQAAQPGWSATSAAPEQLLQLRDACRIAKESLSTETAASIPVRLDALSTDIRVVRAELEDLIGPAAQSSIDLIHDALRRADLNVVDIAAVVAAGGGSSMPLITELLSRATRVPVAVAHRPGITATLGALAIGAAMRAPAAAAPMTTIEPDSAAPTVPAAIGDAGQPIPAGENISEVIAAPRAAEEAPSTTRRWIYRGAAAAVAVAAVGIGFALHSGDSQPQRATAQAATAPASASSLHTTGTSAPASSAAHPTTSTPPGTSAATAASGPNGTSAAPGPGPAQAGQTAGSQPSSNQPAPAPANQAAPSAAPAQGTPDAPAPAPAQNPDPNQSGSQLTIPSPQLPIPRLGAVTQNLLNP